MEADELNNGRRGVYHLGETKRPRAADSVAWPGLTEGLFCTFGPPRRGHRLLVVVIGHFTLPQDRTWVQQHNRPPVVAGPTAAAGGKPREHRWRTHVFIRLCSAISEQTLCSALPRGAGGGSIRHRGHHGLCCSVRPRRCSICGSDDRPWASSPLQTRATPWRSRNHGNNGAEAT